MSHLFLSVWILNTSLEFGWEIFPLDYFSAGRQQSEVVQQDSFNNSGQAINSDFFSDPAVHIQTGEDNLIYSLAAVSTFIWDRALLCVVYNPQLSQTLIYNAGTDA